MATFSEVYNHICEVCESNCFECSTKDEVENDKENSVVEKADLIIKKDMDMKFGVHSMKESSEKDMEVNNELRLNVDELQDDKKV